MMSKKNTILRRLLTLTLAISLYSCSEKGDPSPSPDNGNLVEATPSGSWAAENLKFLIQFTGRDIDPNLFLYNVDIFRVVYKTTYRDTEIEASGLILLPNTADAVPMISFQRGTIVEHADAPSVQDRESEQVLSYAALASMGFITVVPDMIGFGRSKDIFHPYYIEEPTASAVTDLMIAATHLAEQKQKTFNGDVFLAGYSQGGYATLAAHKSLETHPIEGFELIASFPGAGGYDLTEMLDYLKGIETYPDPYYLAYVGMSYENYYDEVGLIDAFFREPYAAKIPSLFDGINSSGDIDGQLTQDISALVREEVLAGNASHPANAFLREKFLENSLVDWIPKAPVFFYHGDADVTVPVANTQTTYDALVANGANSADIGLTILPGKDHSTAIEPYIEDVVKKLQVLKQ